MFNSKVLNYERVPWGLPKPHDAPVFIPPVPRKDPQYFRNELMKMRNDPRNNPNHGRSMEDQEFWNEARFRTLHRHAVWNVFWCFLRATSFRGWAWPSTSSFYTHVWDCDFHGRWDEHNSFHPYSSIFIHIYIHIYIHIHPIFIPYSLTVDDLFMFLILTVSCCDDLIGMVGVSLKLASVFLESKLMNCILYIPTFTKVIISLFP